MYLKYQVSPKGLSNHHNKFWRKSGVPLVELYFGQPYKNTNKRMTQCFGGILYDLTIMHLMSDTFLVNFVFFVFIAELDISKHFEAHNQ